MRRLCIRLLAFLSVLLMAGTFNVPRVWATVPPQDLHPQLMISELQTGGQLSGVEDGKMEFVELYNPGNSPLDVTGWKLEYLSAGHTGVSAPTRVLATFEGVVDPASYLLASFDAYIADADIYFGAGTAASSGLLARGGGHIRIVDGIGSTVDLVGWGTGAAIGSWSRIAEIPAGFSVQRILPFDPLYDIGSGFALPSRDITPRGGGLYVPVPPSVCQGLLITEVLSNPSGADSGREFIEIHNPTNEVIQLKGCELRLGETGKRFSFPDISLAANGYHAFHDTETGIVLPNAVGQTVWLISIIDERGVRYTDALQDDQSWSYFDGVWRATLLPTPGMTNILQEAVQVEEEPLPDLEPEKSPAACPSGKERNATTNRCRNIVPSVMASEVCKVGYERNTETGRCRKLTAATPKVPCKLDQERNPETGRCRSVLGASTEPKACPEGQERNPETNRCRKTAAGTGESLASVQDVRSTSSAADLRWWIAGFLAVGAVGYAVYEWRQDIWQSVAKLKSKVRGKGKPG